MPDPHASLTGIFLLPVYFSYRYLHFVTYNYEKEALYRNTGIALLE